jgi:hypothetical protein
LSVADVRGKLFFIPESGSPRPLQERNLKLVLKRFEETGSFRPKDYTRLTHSSSYYLAVIADMEGGGGNGIDGLHA